MENEIIPSSFEANLSQTEFLDKRPEYFTSPFSKETLIEGIPENITAFADTHSNTGQHGRHGYEGLSQGKRLAAGLSKLKPIRDRVREIDVLSMVAMKVSKPFIKQRFQEGGLIINLGDCVDAVEAGSVFSSYTLSEKQLRPDNNEPQKPVSVLQLDGNHYAFDGPETKMDYLPIHKMHDTLDKDSFKAIVNALQKGKSFQSILRAWNKTRLTLVEKGLAEKVQVAIHPAQKWFMEKIAFGSQIGRFVERDSQEQINKQVSFLHSELNRKWPGFKNEDLTKSLKDLNIADNDPLYHEMMQTLESERQKHEEVATQTLKDSLNGAQTTIYTHNAEQLQEELINKVSSLPSFLEKFNLSESSDPQEIQTKAEEFIQNNIHIFGGHLHLAEHDFGKRKKGTTSIMAMTRQFWGFITQKVVPRSPELLKEAMKPAYTSEIDAPEVLTGSPLEPQTHKITGVRDEYNRLLKSAQQIGAKQ